MASDPTAPGDRVLGLWRSLERWPGGDRLFSFLLGRMVPYSGTIRPRVLELEPGRCRVVIRERRRVRNHLRSVHATALATLGELATGLATLTALPPGVRAILTGLEVEYEKKARGRLTADCATTPPELDDAGSPTAHRAAAEIRDAGGDRVVTLEAVWRLERPRA